MKKVIALCLAMLLLFTCGCSAVKLNTEKDDARTVAVINGSNITKKEFREYLNYNYVYYEVYGGTLPNDEESTDTFITRIYDSFVLLQMLKVQVEELGLSAIAEADENYSFDAAATADTFVKNALAVYTTEQEFDDMLLKYGFDRESLKTAAQNAAVLQNYSTMFFDYGLESCEVASREAMNVNGTAIPASYIYWESVNYILEYYYSNGTAITAENDILSVFENIAKQVATAQGIMDYAAQNNITLTEEELIAARGEASLLELYLGADTMKAYYSDYLLNEELCEQAKEFYANYYAYADKIKTGINEKITYTDEELTDYFLKNVSEYDESTVSAYHILTEDEAFYKLLVKEAGGTAEGFMAAFEKYSAEGQEQIREAKDLGAIGRGEMVTEFETAVFNAKVGDVIENIKTTYGYHLIYVYAKEGTTPQLADIKDKIIADYVAEKGTEEYTTLTDTISEGLEVEYKEYKVLPVELLRADLSEKYSVKLKTDVALAR